MRLTSSSRLVLGPQARFAASEHVCKVGKSGRCNSLQSWRDRSAVGKQWLAELSNAANVAYAAA